MNSGKLLCQKNSCGEKVDSSIMDVKAPIIESSSVGNPINIKSMTSAAMTTTQRPDAFCPPPPPARAAFSIVVDDVDAHGAEDNMLHKLLTEPSLRKCSQYNESKEDSDARIKQIQVEAESRKVEFARLLEEHAQVIRKLKQMEEDGAALGASHA